MNVHSEDLEFEAISPGQHLAQLRQNLRSKFSKWSPGDEFYSIFITTLHLEKKFPLRTQLWFQLNLPCFLIWISVFEMQPWLQRRVNLSLFFRIWHFIVLFLRVPLHPPRQCSWYITSSRVRGTMWGAGIDSAWVTCGSIHCHMAPAHQYFQGNCLHGVCSREL